MPPFTRLALVALLATSSVFAAPAPAAIEESQNQHLEARVGAINYPVPFPHPTNGKRGEEEVLDRRVGAINYPVPFPHPTNGKRGEEEGLEKRVGAINYPVPFPHPSNGKRGEEEGSEKRVGAINYPVPFPHPSNGKRDTISLLADYAEDVLHTKGIGHDHAVEKRVGAINYPVPFPHPSDNKRDIATPAAAAVAAVAAGELEERDTGKQLLRPQRVKRASVCNGDASLCSRTYAQTVHIGTHNSYAIGRVNQAQVGYNQAKPIKQQLDEGIRLLQVQAHVNQTSTGASGIDLCHTSCSLVNGGSLESYLSIVKTWLDANPNEVVTLLIVNSDDQAPSKFASAFESTGLSSKAYRAPSASMTRDSWPTLGALLDGGTPLVVFIDNSADLSTVPYILPEFTNMWENKFGQTSLPFSCDVDRVDTSTDASGLMYLVNHFLDTSNTLFGIDFSVPNTAQLGTTNGAESIRQNLEACKDQHGGVYPTFVLLDFYDAGYGAPMQVAAALNGVAYRNMTVKSGGGSGSGGSGGGGGSSSSSSGGGSSGSASSAAAPAATAVTNVVLLPLLGLVASLAVLLP